MVRLTFKNKRSRRLMILTNQGSSPIDWGQCSKVGNAYDKHKRGTYCGGFYLG